MPSDSYYPYLLEAVSVHNVLPVTSRCNLACIFCSHKQSPPGLSTFRLPQLPSRQIFELAEFLDPKRKIIIGESATRLNEGEPFTHPELLLILHHIRNLLPGTMLALTTNGTLLSDEVLSELSELLPLELTISLNSISEKGRRKLLGDSQSHRIRDIMVKIGQKRLPFHGSLVAMPHLVGMDDIINTVRFLAEHGSLTVRMFLPGYTKYTAHNLRLPLSGWSKLEELAAQLTRELNMPVIPEPSPCQNLNAEICGVIRDTPAVNAGLIPGDVIYSVDGKPVRTRVEAFRLAKEAPDPLICLSRMGKDIEVVLSKKQDETPGFVVFYDFDPERLNALEREMKRARFHAPLFLSSQLGADTLKCAVSLLGLSKETVIPVSNTFFGGSIMSAGLLVMDDLLAAARLVDLRPHDILFVPAEAFDRNGLDLTGRNLNDLEEVLGIPVRAV